MKNYYEELGIEKNADISEIKKAYLSLLKKYHPDLPTDITMPLHWPLTQFQLM